MKTSTEETIVSGAGFAARALTAAVLFAVTADATHAQTEERSARSGGSGAVLEEIIVSARRREESLQDVPVAVSVFTKEDLLSNNVNEIGDLLLRTPNVTTTLAGGGPDRTQIAIRGIAGTGGAVQPFGIYLNEFSFGLGGTDPAQIQAARVIDMDALDLERVEILKGPQGTSFGRNTTAGALLFTSTRPGEEFNVTLEADIGGEGASDYDNMFWMTRATVNVPLADGHGVRFRAYARDHEGWIKDVGPAGNTNDRDFWGVSGTYSGALTDRLSLDVTGMYSERERGSNEYVGTGEGLGGDAQAYLAINNNGQPLNEQGIGFFPNNDDTIATNEVMSASNETTVITGRLGYDGNGYRASVIAGYVENRTIDQVEDMGTPTVFQLSTNGADSKAWSVELRVESDPLFDNKIELIGGVIIGEEDSANILDADYGPDSVTLPPVDLLRPAVNEHTYEYWGVFGEAIWSVTDKLEITAGVRYSEDDVETNYFVNSGLPFLNIPPTQDSISFDDVSPRLVAQYQFSDDIMFYGSAGRGYKAGGYAAVFTVPALNIPYEEESLWSYEAGLKSTLFDGKARFNAAAFYIEWDDLQSSFFDAPLLATRIGNAASASSEGVELELLLAPNDYLQLGLSYGHTRAVYDEFPDCPVFGGATADCSGLNIPGIAENSVSAFFEANRPLAGSEGFFRAEYTWQDDRTFVEDGQEVSLVPDYDQFNLRAGLRNEKWSATLYGENVFGDIFFTSTRFLSFFLTGRQAVVMPRTFGLRVSYDL